MDIDDIDKILDILRRLAIGDFDAGREVGTSERGEIIKTDDSVYITFELWDLPEDFKLEAVDDHINLVYSDEFNIERKKKIILPCKVNPKSLDYSVNNRIVDIKLRRIEDGELEEGNN